MPPPVNSLLTTSELCELFDVDRRQVTTWKKAGCPVAAQRKGRGRPADLFDSDDVSVWLAENRRGGIKRASRAVHARSADDDDDDEGGDDEPKVDLSALSADEITAMRDRLSIEEQSLSILLQDAKKKRDPASYLAWHKAWLDVCTIRARVAKELPGIMRARGRYVDVDDVGRTIAEAVTVFASSLDRVGTSVAEQCTGRTAPEIADIIDSELDKHRTLLVEALEHL